MMYFGGYWKTGKGDSDSKTKNYDIADNSDRVFPTAITVMVNTGFGFASHIGGWAGSCRRTYSLPGHEPSATGKPNALSGSRNNPPDIIRGAMLLPTATPVLVNTPVTITGVSDTGFTEIQFWLIVLFVLIIVLVILVWWGMRLPE